MIRRYFLKLAGLLLLAALSPRSLMAALRGSHQREVIEDTKRALVGLLDTPSSIEVGREYLRRFPHEDDAVLLIALLDIAKPGDQRALARRLKRSMSSDFENGKTVQLGGWMLSRTEVRVCALVSLVGTKLAAPHALTC